MVIDMTMTSTMAQVRNYEGGGDEGNDSADDGKGGDAEDDDADDGNDDDDVEYSFLILLFLFL